MKLQLLELVAASVAVAVTAVVPTGNTEPEATLVVTVGVEQLSVAVGVAKFTAMDVAEVLGGSVTTIFAGQDKTGAVVSLTVTLVVAVLLFPAASVAVTVIWCVPNPTGVPAAGLWETVTEPQLSEAELPAVTSGIGA